MSNENRELAKKLAGYEAFENCTQKDLEALAAAGSPFSLPAGWPLVQEGIPADACYVITAGAARVFHKREQIAEIGPGDVVGEMTLFGGGQRSATVTTSERVQGLRIENAALEDVFARHEAVASAFRAVYVKHGGQ